eukprot:CAMPEP_0118655452 /NCGR_PEP_ID=MMETSP0785-20121206/12932_1 /TAXON_ID=91992 /ORGANISM="Bolidomonas pacifica, Strain CCMP 1866" /LENGTH=55 /DNA_ID=CAMNT_0006548183 /DNA_START=147 /DNA_END=310 /DNA_ORIENTATION=-
MEEEGEFEVEGFFDNLDDDQLEHLGLVGAGNGNSLEGGEQTDDGIYDNERARKEG